MADKPAVAKDAAMNFFISDTFTDSLTRLPAQEQKAVKTAWRCGFGRAGLAFENGEHQRALAFRRLRICYNRSIRSHHRVAPCQERIV